MRHHVNRYKCQFCDMTCATPHDLSNHIRHRHLDEKPFSCEYCDYKYVLFNLLKVLVHLHLFSSK